MIRKILTILVLCVLFSNPVLAYGGGANFIYAQPTIDAKGKLHHIQIFDKETSFIIAKDFLYKLSFDLDNKPKKNNYFDIYEINKDETYLGLDVYKILEIKTNLEDINKVDIEFKVPELFTKKNEIKVIYVKYGENESFHKTIKVEFIKERLGYNYYKISTNNFSEFVIGKESIEEGFEKYEKEIKEEPMLLDSNEEISSNANWWIFGIIILIVALILIFKPKKEKNYDDDYD